MKTAFTLVEILIGLALLAIILGIGIPISYTATQRQQVEQARQTVETALETARNYAASGKRVASINCISKDYRLAGWGVYFGADYYQLLEYCTVDGQLNSCPNQSAADYGSALIKYFAKGAVTMPQSGTLARNPVIFMSLNRGVCGLGSGASESLMVTNGSFSKAVTVDSLGQIQ